MAVPSAIIKFGIGFERGGDVSSRTVELLNIF